MKLSLGHTACALGASSASTLSTTHNALHLSLPTMTGFQYSPLDASENCIRLLRIERGYWCDDIVCWLFESFPGQARGPAYKALSYTWGGGKHKQGGPESRVLIDKHEFGVSENLFSALRQIRRGNQEVTIWIDAICINQKDKKEKGHQVKQMGDIYKGAEEVLIWLGPGDHDIETLMKSVTWVDGKATEAQALGNTTDWMSLCRRFMHQLPPDLGIGADAREALAELLRRHWFERVWILQEVANARTATIMSGSGSCPARTFAMMPSLTGLQVAEHTQAVLDIMPRFRGTTWWSSKPDLHYLLGKFAESKACHVRDKIYALLGMSEDACNPQRFYPCYEKTDDQVFRDTASFLLFGYVLDASHLFPRFTFPELCLPKIQLAEKTLSGTLGATKKLRDSARKTAVLLVSRLNEGQFKTPELLLSLAAKHGRVDDLQNLSSLGSVEISIGFEDGQDTLTIDSKERRAAPVALCFPWTQETSELPAPPFKENEDMTEVILRLREAGSSQEEILRACAWAGDEEGVQRAIEAGADLEGADSRGCTALHFATWRGGNEVTQLLIRAGANVDVADAKGNTPLLYAALLLQEAEHLGAA